MNNGPIAGIDLARDECAATWDTYVESHPLAKPYHLAGWSKAVADLFGLETHYLAARSSSGEIVGVLPLVRQRNLVFGDRLTSLPFFNYGGALADDETTREALMARARELARELRVDRLELRDTVPPPAGWHCRSDKATLVLDLPTSAEGLSKGFGSKLRSQIKRAEREQPEVSIGGAELVADFYSVFAQVMRDLGTPVYPRRFFECLAERFSSQCTIVSVRHEDRPVAGAFLIGHRDTLEVPWAGTIAAMKARATNMVLYAEALKLAVTRGYRRFDFGRSTVDSGPYRFKRQWGAVPAQLHWSIWPDELVGKYGSATDGERFSAATRLWSRLPLVVANRLGPLISPSLPW
jgi:FemAB-related protein (PEP-CTERM system-associated)